MMNSIRLGLLILAGHLLACSEPSQNTLTASPDTPPTAVTVAEVVQQTITQWQEFTGRLQAPQTVEVRPRVSGYVNRVAFNEGSLVQQGQLLFEIDPRPLRLEQERLQAELISAQAGERLAASDLLRAQGLHRQKAIAVGQLEARVADLEQARARVASVQAELRAASLRLSFTRVIAPIAGRVSRARVSEGNYVTEGETALTTLVSANSMYAYFDADEQSFLRYQQLWDSDQQGLNSSPGKVRMQLINEDSYDHSGSIDFIDNQVNPQTGTIRFRAVFANPSKRLTPGLFVRLQVAGGERESVLIDDRAIATDLTNKYVLVLNSQDKLEYRRITIGSKYAGLRIVEEGLSAGEKIVVKGLQRVFPGSEVQAEIIPMAGERNNTERHAG